jgi:hypothetical protein
MMLRNSDFFDSRFTPFSAFAIFRYATLHYAISFASRHDSLLFRLITFFISFHFFFDYHAFLFTLRCLADAGATNALLLMMLF